MIITSAQNSEEIERLRAGYDEELRSGRAEFFHLRNTSCPWCGAGDIALLAFVSDTRQGKPGVFRMDECGSCGHVFQNPMLTEVGLAYYYRDFYDGVGRDHYASVARLGGRGHRNRVRLVACRSNPATWLDVGARHGHFCREAREILPGTRFSAIDPSPEVWRARERGWVDDASQLPLTDYADAHESEFDVVSMIHHLERAAEPKRELAAARKVLRRGGLLLVELVNPGSRFARLHRRYWYCWLAPQNLHLMPWRNVARFLEDNGFAVLEVQLGKASKPFDNVGAVLTALNHHLPPARRWPWLTRQVRWSDKVFRKAVMTLCLPLMLLAFAVDLLSHLVISRGRGGNSYRIVAVHR